MLNRIFTNPIALIIDDQTVKFSSVQDFEFALVGRDSIPASKVCATMTTSPARLEDELNANRELQERLTSILAKSGGKPGALYAALKDLELAQFSRDHKWRDIMNALKNAPDKDNEFCHIALAKYIQYLKARNEVIAIFSTRKKSKSSGAT